MNDEVRETTDGIPREVLDRAHRKLCRKVASVLIAAMAEADMGPEEMAAAMGGDTTGRWVRRYLTHLINGTSHEFREMSDLAAALNCEWDLSLRELPHQEATGDAEQPPP